MKVKKKGWIINSLIDVDAYKLTMGQLAFLFFRHVLVVFGFKNRTKKVFLPDTIKEKDLRAELDHVRDIKGITDEEADYLRGRKIYRESFVGFLRTLVLPEYKLEVTEGGYEITFEGAWPEVTLWETLCLSIMNELYYKALLDKMPRAQRRAVYAEGRRRLAEKIRILKENPDIRFIEFGTRRRFSRLWQEYVFATLLREVPEQIMGSSNVALSMKYGTEPVGTFAHEMYMVFSGIFRDKLRESHNMVIQYWWDLYGELLSIALTDTYGTDFFFRDLTKEQAEKLKGLRQDSGDPFEFGEKTIKFYEEHGIDPRGKTIVFSDGLDIDLIVRLNNYFRGRIKVSFGWGTNLTNDLGLDALSLVVKVIKAAGHWTVKLSDNLAKAMGPKAEIALFKEVFGHNVTFKEACVY